MDVNLVIEAPTLLSIAASSNKASGLKLLGLNTSFLIQDMLQA